MPEYRPGTFSCRYARMLFPSLTRKPVSAAKPYEQMSVEELQGAILAKLAANGPVTDRMRREVAENVYRDSLLNWVRSFR